MNDEVCHLLDGGIITPTCLQMIRIVVHPALLNKLSLIVESERLANKVQSLADILRVPIQLMNEVDVETTYQLVRTEARLELRSTGKGAPGPVFIDFVSGKSAHRRQFGGGRGQPLARAVGLKKGETPTILDATAGLGRDAFVLATLGCKVTLIERSPIVHALLADAIERALQDSTVADIVDRFTLINANAIEFMKTLSGDERPDVVHLDPMYPHRDKSALVKKEMRVFRDIVGDDLDSAQLLSAARECALKRVAVKRPIKADYLGGMKPDAEIKSPNTRYDLYFSYS